MNLLLIVNPKNLAFKLINLDFLSLKEVEKTSDFYTKAGFNVCYITQEQIRTMS